MNKFLLSAAVAGVVAAGIATTAPFDAQASKEKCYGVAEAGKNDCASADGSHSCAGQAKADNDVNEWKYVADAAACEEMGGKTTAPTAETVATEVKTKVEKEIKTKIEEMPADTHAH